MSEFVVVLVTVPSPAEAERIASALVEERLAACVNAVGPIRSVYRWEGKLQNDEEWLLVIKSRAASFAALAARVRTLHSYDTPEVVALPVVAGSDSYLAWLAAATNPVPTDSQS